MIPHGNIPLNSVIPFFFDAFDGGTGASITLTGIAITDVEIFKGISMTQRASDAGVVLLDTDGIDVDGITGIHGFSIDTSDNTDAGFYVAGSFYTVVVASVTIDGQTVNFVAGNFRLTAAEGVAGVPDVNVTHVGDTTQTAGDIMADTNDIQARLPAALVAGRIDASVGAMAANVMTAAAAAADLTTELQTGLATQASVNTIDDLLDTEILAIIATLGTPAGASLAADIAAIEAQTDDIGVAGAGLTALGDVRIANLDAAVSSRLATAGYTAPPTTADVADKLLGRSIAGAADGGRTVQSALRLLRNKREIVAGVLTVYVEDDVTPAWTGAVATAAGNPVSSIDP